MVVLALGVGANVTVFSALRHTILAPPPFPEPERLVVADLTVVRSPERGPDRISWSFPKFEYLLEHPDRPFSNPVGYTYRSATLTGVGQPEVLSLEVVTPGYFELFGNAPALGRAFDPEESAPGSDVVIVGHEFWTSRLGSDPDVLERSVTLNGSALRIVGVGPEGYAGVTGSAELWIPFGATASVYAPFMLENAQTHWFQVAGRLAEGTTLESGRDRMAAIGEAVAEEYPASNTSRVYSATLRSLDEVRNNEGARASVLFLTLAAGLVLLVATANLSGLLLARARRRSGDRAVRVAVGASRWRLMRAALTESLVVAALGGAAGVAVAVFGTRALAAAWPSRFTTGQDGTMQFTDPETFSVDPVALVLALALTVTAAALAGLAPALRSLRRDPLLALRSGASSPGGRGSGFDARAGLVTAQVALALVLIIGAGLVGDSTLRLLRVDEGFDAERILTFGYTIPPSNSRVEDPRPLHDAFLEEVRRIPGVETATFGCAPLRGHCIITRVDAVEGAPEIPPGEGVEIGVRMVDDVHFAALGIPIRRGRPFDATDGLDRTPGIIISETAAREIFGEEDPLGRAITLGIGSAERDARAEVIGVVGDVLYSRPEDGHMAEAYFSYRDYPESFANVSVRTTGDPLSVVPALRAALERVDPTLALFRIETMDELAIRSIGDRRTTLALLALFAVVTILLAATGTWGVISYAVADRRRELGLRMALGAEAGGVVRGVVAEGMRLGGAGIVAGVLVGLWASRLLGAVLWQTEPTAPWVYGSGAALLFGVVLLASWLPARRAARVDPVEALRVE